MNIISSNVIRKHFVKLHVFLRKTLDFVLRKCYSSHILINTYETFRIYRLEAEVTLENLIKLSAEGARQICRISQAKGQGR